MSAEVEVINDATGRSSLTRDVQFKHSPHESRLGDHMLTEFASGVVEDVAIVKEAGELKARIFVPNIEISSGRGFFSFQDVDAETERRLLALHKMFATKVADAGQ